MILRLRKQAASRVHPQRDHLQFFAGLNSYGIEFLPHHKNQTSMTLIESLKKWISESLSARMQKILLFLVVLIAISVINNAVKPTIGVSDPRFQLITSLLSLIALIMPALALLLQAALKLANQPIFKISGFSEEIRRVSLWTIGISSTSLALAVLIVANYVDISFTLQMILSLIVLSIAAFALLPFAFAYTLTGSDLKGITQLMDMLSEWDSIEKIDGLSNEEIELIEENVEMDLSTDRQVEENER